MLATDHGVATARPAHTQAAARVGEAARPVFQGHDAAPPEGGPSFDYADRDLFAEMVRTGPQRGMKVYARILESGSRAMQNVAKVATIDVNGQPTQTRLLEPSGIQGFWNATVEDLFRSYDWTDSSGARNARVRCERDPERERATRDVLLRVLPGARQGARHRRRTRAHRASRRARCTSAGCGRGRTKPADGAAAGFLRILFRYPEILAWEYQYRLSREEVMAGMYQAIKANQADRAGGLARGSWATSMDIIARAAMSYAEMAPYSDYLKVVVYHAVTGPRIRTWVQNVQRSVLSELTLEEALDLHYDLFGYDKKVEPKANEPTQTGGSPDYVYRETRAASAAPRARRRSIRASASTSPAARPTILKTSIKPSQGVRRRRGRHRGFARI